MKCRSCSRTVVGAGVTFCSEECLNGHLNIKSTALTGALDEAAVMTQKLARAARREIELQQERDQAIAQMRALQLERDRALSRANSLQEELASATANLKRASQNKELEDQLEELRHRLATSQARLAEMTKLAEDRLARVIFLENELAEKEEVRAAG